MPVLVISINFFSSIRCLMYTYTMDRMTSTISQALQSSSFETKKEKLKPVQDDWLLTFTLTTTKNRPKILPIKKTPVC